MRIAINAFPLRADGGGARYVFTSLFDALLALPREDTFLIFIRKDAVALIADSVRTHAAKAQAIIVRDPSEIADHRDRFDLLFAPINELGPRLADKPSVVILHDIIESILPDAFLPAEARDRAARHAATARDCTTLVAISKTCRQSFIDVLHVPANKTAVVYNAPQAAIIDRTVRQTAGDGTTTESIAQTPEAAASSEWPLAPLPARFVFYPANTFAHKNHTLLLDVIAAVPEAVVVFTGYDVLGGFPLAREIERRGLADRAIRFTNLATIEMRHLYHTALATVLPTAYEGFGLPAVESLASGCPLICTDLPALREVAGDDAAYLPVGDRDAWMAALRMVFASPRRAVPEATSERICDRFNWSASARAMAAVFDETAQRFETSPRPTFAPLQQPNAIVRLARRLPLSWQDRLARWRTRLQ